MNRLLYILAVMATLCLYSCGGDDNKLDEPENPQEQSKAFVYNHTPLNDFIVSFAGNTDGLTTQEVLEKAAENFQANRDAMVGKSLDFLPSIKLYAQGDYYSWSSLKPVRYLYFFNDVLVSISILTDAISKDEWEKYKDAHYDSYLQVTGKYRDGGMTYPISSYDGTISYDVAFMSFAVDNATVTLINDQ